MSFQSRTPMPQNLYASGGLPRLSLRELTYRADTVVLGVPVDRASSGRFKVTQVLRGAAVKAGATVELAADERTRYSLAAFTPPTDPSDDDESVTLRQFCAVPDHVPAEVRYMLSDSRMNVAGIMPHNVAYVAESIAAER